MPFVIFLRGSFAVRDHLQSNLGIISGLGIICGRGSFAALYSTFKLFFLNHLLDLFKNRSVQTADLNFGFCFYRTDMKYQECRVATAERFRRCQHRQHQHCLLSEGLSLPTDCFQDVQKRFQTQTLNQNLSRILRCLPAHPCVLLYL